MPTFTKTIYDRLRNDATLVALLGSTNDSIITGEQTPPIGSLWPIVWAYGFTSFEDAGVKNSGGVRFTKDLIVMSRELASSQEVETIAQHIYFLFNRQPFAIEGYNSIVVEASGPRSMPSDENISAMTVSLTVHAMEI